MSRDQAKCRRFQSRSKTQDPCAIGKPVHAVEPHAFAERFVKTIKYECLNRLVLFWERHLRYVVKEFMAHYHAERFHQGLGGQLIEVRPGSTNQKGTRGKVVCRSRLGGMLDEGF